MVYVVRRSSFTNRYKFYNSDTRETLDVEKIDGKFCYSCDKTPVRGVECVLGYINGVLLDVPDKLLDLMGYVDRVVYANFWDIESSIKVCNSTMSLNSEHNIFCRVFLAQYYSILDVLMCASYNEKFPLCVKNGVIPCQFADNGNYLVIYLCSNSESYVSKLVTLYRNEWEKEEKLTSKFLLYG